MDTGLGDIKFRVNLDKIPTDHGMYAINVPLKENAKALYDAIMERNPDAVSTWACIYHTQGKDTCYNVRANLGFERASHAPRWFYENEGYTILEFESLLDIDYSELNDFSVVDDIGSLFE